jgi:hypothetical protein
MSFTPASLHINVLETENKHFVIRVTGKCSFLELNRSLRETHSLQAFTDGADDSKHVPVFA